MSDERDLEDEQFYYVYIDGKWLVGRWEADRQRFVIPGARGFQVMGLPARDVHQIGERVVMPDEEHFLSGSEGETPGGSSAAGTRDERRKVPATGPTGADPFAVAD